MTSDQTGKNGSQAKILVVDDRIENLFAIKKTLESLDVELFTAQSGHEALALLLHHDFALALIDVQMPEMDGFELASLIHNNELTEHIPIIFLTAIIKDDFYISKGYATGAVDYLVKPIDPDIVQNKVRVFSELYLQRKALEAEIEVRKQIQEQLRDSEAQVRQVCAELELKTNELLTANREWAESFDSINDAITIHSTEYDIIRANRAAEQLFDLPLEQIVGRKCYDLYHGRHCPPEGCPSCAILKTGQPCEFEVYEPNLDKFVQVRAMSRLNSRNDIAGMVHIVQDISHRKQAEEEKEQLQAQLRQTQKLEAIGTLAGGIAHDFNNILMAMLGYTDMSRKAVPEGSQIWRNLEQVLIAGNRAKKLVKQILCFSRNEEQIQESIEIAPVITEALAMLRSSIPTTIEICQDIEAHGSSIMADPTQIHQVLINLCTNALHAMEDRCGVLTVTLTEIEIESTQVTHHGTLQPGPYVRLTVSDTGCGMDTKTTARIFEPFYTTKAVDKGTGMGLSVVHGIVESHGGGITVESEPGQGTTFRVFFPRIDHTDTSEAPCSEIRHDPRECILRDGDEAAMVDPMDKKEVTI